MLHFLQQTCSRKTYVIIAMATIIAAGFLLRVWDLGEQSLWIDEGFSLNAALATVENGYPLLASGEIYGNSWLSIYTTAGVITFAGLDPFNPWAVRLPSVIMGLGVIVIAFLLSRLLFKNTGLALLLAALIALSYWEIDWSRQVRGYVGLQFFILSSLLYLYRWLESKKMRHLILVGTFFVLALMHHSLALVFAPAFAVAVLCYLVLNPKNSIRRKHIYIGVILISLLAVATVHFELVNIRRISYDYSSYYASFLFSGLAPISFAALGGLVLGIFDKKRFWPVMFVAINVLFPLVVIMLYGEVANLRYLFPLYPLMIMLALYGIARLVSFIPKIDRKEAWVAISITTVVIFSGQITLRPNHFYQFEFDSPRPDFKNAYALIRDNRQEGDIILSPYAHMTNVFLGEKGYWLPISFNGVRRRLEANLIDGTYDKYVYAPAVTSRDHPETLIAENHGFIIVDGMANIRLGPLLPIIVEHPKTSILHQSGESLLNRMWVYRF